MTGKLNAALVAAQTELHAPSKNRTVTVRSEKGSYKFDYATLDNIVEQTLRPILPKHGLWFVQGVRDGQMVTTILHSSGESLDCGIPMPNLPAKAQEAGSLISYFKRYSLCAAFGLVAEEDDDANVASGNSFAANDRNGNGLKQQLQESVRQADRDAPFPQGPCKNKTELKTKAREAWREIEGCGDPDEMESAIRAHDALLKQLRDALPDWWDGGTRAGEPYEGLSHVIERKRRDFADIAEAGGDWKNNPVLAG